MLFLALLVFGFIGLVIMALMGSLRVGSHRGLGRGMHHGHAHPVGHHSSSHPAAVHHGHAGAQAAPGAGHQATAARPQVPTSKGVRLSKNLSWLLQGLSPIDLFAMAMGAGALGIIGRKAFHNEALAAYLAIAGAILMDLAVVRPIFSMLLRFASSPSEGLEGTINQLAEAATGFDEQGRGLIRLNLDGQTSQILATLEPDELAEGIHVHKGDSLVVLEVDSSRNICRVSREIASSD